MAPAEPLALRSAQPQAQGYREFFRDLGLDDERVGDRAIQDRSPELRSVVDVDEFGADDERARALEDATGQHGLHAQKSACLRRVGILSLVSKDGAARHHAQTRNLRQVVDEALGESITQVVELLIVALIHQRKHCQRFDDSPCASTTWRRCRLTLRRGAVRVRERCGSAAPRVRLIHGDPQGLVDAPGVQRARQRTQIANYLGARLVTLVSILPQRGPHDSLELIRHAAGLGERLGLAKENGADDVRRGGALERRLPGQHLVQEDPQRKQVRSRIDVAAARLFRGHVVEGAHDDAVAGLDEPRRGVVILGEALTARELCQAEVQDLHVAVDTDHHVFGLQVAMDDAGLMRGGDGLGNLHGDGERVWGVEAAALEHGPQRDAVDELRGQELHLAVVADVVHGEDVGVIERRDRARLPLESPHRSSSRTARGESTFNASRRPRRTSSARYT